MKKFTKILCCTLGLGFLLTGCATVGNIKNSNDELIYNGNSAVMVDGYLYYGNAYADYSGFEGDNDYNSSAKLSYLARLNTNVELASKTKDYSPKTVEKVSGEVSAHSNDFMFVLGNYIYYAIPNKQKAIDSEDNASKHFYNYTTILRSNLNGDNKEKVYTTNGEVSKIEVVKYSGKYYIVILAGSDLIKIKIGNNFSASVVASDVTSVAIPETYQKDKVGSSLDWNGYIFYTTNKTVEDNSDISGSEVKRVLVSGGDAEVVDWIQGRTVSFLDREEDIVFYTLSGHETEVYKSDVSSNNNEKNAFINTRENFYSASSISNINKVATENKDYGYVFSDSADGLGYYVNTTKKTGKITFTAGDTELSSYNILLVSGRTAYLSTTTGIYKADLSNVFNGNGGSFEVLCETIVEMTAIHSGSLYAYDGKYIYYYAQLEEVESEDESEDDAEEETDENYYLYRSKIGASVSDNYQLLSLTKNSKRHSK